MSRRSRSKHSEPKDALERAPSLRRPATGKPTDDRVAGPGGGARDGDGGSWTEYESDQVRQIAVWKAEKPSIRTGLFTKIGPSVARFAERLIPSQVAQGAIAKVYEEAELAATRGDIERQADVHDLGELRHRPLQECDRLAHGIGVWAKGLAVAGGAATGAGGFLTSALDVPVLLTLALRTILKIGHCYGYPLDQPKDRRIVMGILMVAATDDPEKKQELLARLKEVEDWMLRETEGQLVEDEAMDLLLQVEIFDDIPGLGAITAGLENYAFIHQAAEASRRVFQERWLQDNGKVEAIEPALDESLAGTGSWQSGLMSRLFYSGSYYISYGTTLPVWIITHALASAGNALIRGLREGAAAAVEGADRTVDRLRDLAVLIRNPPSESVTSTPA